jgi:hypothetical protein
VRDLYSHPTVAAPHCAQSRNLQSATPRTSTSKSRPCTAGARNARAGRHGTIAPQLQDLSQ